MRLELLLRRTVVACTRGAWVHSDHVGLCCFGTHLLGTEHQLKGLLKCNLQGFYCNTWGAEPVVGTHMAGCGLTIRKPTVSLLVAGPSSTGRLCEYTHYGEEADI